MSTETDLEKASAIVARVFAAGGAFHACAPEEVGRAFLHFLDKLHGPNMTVEKIEELRRLARVVLGSNEGAS